MTPISGLLVRAFFRKQRANMVRGGPVDWEIKLHLNYVEINNIFILRDAGAGKRTLRRGEAVANNSPTFDSYEYLLASITRMIKQRRATVVRRAL